MVIVPEYPGDLVKMVDVTLFTIYFVHEPLDFVFTLAGNFAKIVSYFSQITKKEKPKNIILYLFF
jgi:hypothetical protein